jgi:hypothetical protein
MMIRHGILAVALVIFAISSFGCGGGSPKVEKKDPFKARSDTQPKEKQETFMKPGKTGSPSKTPG